MIFLYNILQFLFMPLLLPALCIASLLPKYRGRLPRRLGIGMNATWKRIAREKTTRTHVVWIHGLSVGEIVSAKPLVQALRVRLPLALILVTTTTRAGETIARKTLADQVDIFAPFPIDFYPVVHLFLRKILPDIYIQVETDFWPNFLGVLQKKAGTRVLVNGRLSQRSFQRYRSWSFLSQRIFPAFSMLFMQTQKDAGRMVDLGVPQKKIFTCGNLKFDAALSNTHGHSTIDPDLVSFFPADIPRVIVGSSHPGEEKVIFEACSTIFRHSSFFLIIAPRDPARGEEILSLAASFGISGFLRTTPENGKKLMVLNTVGELAGLYGQCDLAIMGGSFSVAVAGHNPLEPAIHAKPVLFGPYMENFHEIAALLLEAGCAWQVTDAHALAERIQRLLDHPDERVSAGSMAAQVVTRHSGAADRVADAILSAHTAREDI